MTIVAMAKLGPWLLSKIDDVRPDSATCTRCGKRGLRWVWQMELQREPRRVERIGSECGPRLEEVSAELWGEFARPFKGRLELLQRLERCESRLIAHPTDAPGAAYAGDWSDALRRELLTLETRRVRIRAIGRELSQLDKVLRRKKLEREHPLGPEARRR